MKILWMVIPCYNEEEVLPVTAGALKRLYADLMRRGRIAPDSKIAFVNDGSTDGTWGLIESLYAKDRTFAGIDLSRNLGHQNAVLAGLMTAKEHADVVISMDADLQDDLGAIEKMLDESDKGADIVYGVRSSRKKDSFFKRFTAQTFYKLLKAMGVETVYNHADFRLMSRRSLEALAEFREVNLFLRGIVPQIGLRTAVVTYERGEREAGQSKYPLKKMLALAWEGVSSFSVRPLKFALHLAAFALVAALALLGTGLGLHYGGGHDLTVYLVTASVFFIGSMVLLAVGIVGQYIGKIYLETKRRPRYIVRDVLYAVETATANDAKQEVAA